MTTPLAEFDELDRTLATRGPGGVIEALIRHLDDRADYRGLLDALLLKARHELGLPLIQAGSLADLPEPTRTAFEDRYVEAIRTVGTKLLAAGEIAPAWAYFRAIAEKEPVARAIEAFHPEPNDDRLGAVVEVAFNGGVHPRRGFDLILDHYGTCSAITAFDSLPAEAAIRVHAADRLVRRLHADLDANLRAEIGRRGQPVPPEGSGIAPLVEGRDWLFADDSYHLDVSHLASTVRLSPLLEDPATIAMALGLTQYGRRLSERHRYEGDPPFEDHYEDHAAYLGALLGRDVEGAIARFRGKLPAGEPGEQPRDEAVAAQVLVRLLDRLARPGEAFEVAVAHLGHLPESALGCPGPAQLCLALGRLDRLAALARDHGDLVQYASAVLSQPR